MNIVEYLAENNPEAALLDDMDNCIIGTKGYGEEMVAVYDYNLIIAHLVTEGMSEEDAIEHYDYNIERSLPYIGINAPIIINVF